MLKFLIEFISNVVIAIFLAIIFILFYVSDSLKKLNEINEAFDLLKSGNAGRIIIEIGEN